MYNARSQIIFRTCDVVHVIEGLPFLDITTFVNRDPWDAQTTLCEAKGWEFAVIDSLDKLRFLQSRPAIFTPSSTTGNTYVRGKMTPVSPVLSIHKELT